mmetsp:Transcript_79306/g.220541  ORF Transcript_79306/g.220541 Transcript_79306/m.220541 type:complete len:250 (+) Transcript_79306:358-1107(+)
MREEHDVEDLRLLAQQQPLAAVLVQQVHAPRPRARAELRGEVRHRRVAGDDDRPRGRAVDLEPHERDARGSGDLAVVGWVRATRRLAKLASALGVAIHIEADETRAATVQARGHIHASHAGTACRGRVGRVEAALGRPLLRVCLGSTEAGEGCPLFCARREGEGFSEHEILGCVLVLDKQAVRHLRAFLLQFGARAHSFVRGLNRGTRNHDIAPRVAQGQVHHGDIGWPVHFDRAAPVARDGRTAGVVV